MPKIPLSFGEYEWPRSFSQEMARSLFYRAIQQEAPEVLADLEQRALWRYRRLVPHLGGLQDRTLVREDAGDSRFLPQPYPAGFRNRTLALHALEKTDDWTVFQPMEVGEQVHAWSQEWHLDAPWCRHRAMWTLNLWCDYLLQHGAPPAGGFVAWGWALHGSPLPKPPCTDEELIRDLQLPVYRPWEMTRAQAQQEYAAYMRRVDALVEARGMVPVPEKRREDHLVWLVRRQIDGRTFAEIAQLHTTETESPNENTISQAVAKLAGLIGLELREPPRRGRLPKAPKRLN